MLLILFIAVGIIVFPNRGAKEGIRHKGLLMGFY